MQRRNSRMIARIRKHTTLQMSGKKCVHSPPPPPPPPPPPLIIIVIIIIIRSLMSLGGWSQEMDTTMYEIVGSRSKKVLKRMQKAALSGTFNIAWTFKVVT